MNFVIDASVAVKWFFPQSPEEQNTDQAISILQRIGSGKIEPLQPVHWVPEVVAVINRLDPNIVDDAIDLLDAMEFATVDRPEIYKRASAIARETSQHVFDTLYHAVAIEQDVVLVTADTKYFNKAEKLGRLVTLDRWEQTVSL